MKEPDLNTICSECGNLRIGMNFDLVNGIAENTMLCHICDETKFDTIFIYSPIEHNRSYIANTEFWKVYKMDGKLRK